MLSLNYSFIISQGFHSFAAKIFGNLSSKVYSVMQFPHELFKFKYKGKVNSNLILVTDSA